MAAFLLLPASADLTLADVEAWVARARSLGADDDSVVQLGEPPLASKRDGSLALSVPVTVTRTVLPSGGQAGPRDSATTQRARRRRARGNTGRRSAGVEAAESAESVETQVGSTAPESTAPESPVAQRPAPESPVTKSPASGSPVTESPATATGAAESATTSPGTTSPGTGASGASEPTATPTEATSSGGHSVKSVKPAPAKGGQEPHRPEDSPRPTPPPRLTFSNPAGT